MKHLSWFWTLRRCNTEENCDIWFLLKSVVQTGTHYWTRFARLHKNAISQPQDLLLLCGCSTVAELKANMRQCFLREPQPPPNADPCFLLHHALWAVTPSLHHGHCSHTSAAFHPCSCWEDVSVWLKALWEISTTRPSRGHEEGTRAIEWARAASLFLQKAASQLKSNLAEIKTNKDHVRYAVLIYNQTRSYSQFGFLHKKHLCRKGKYIWIIYQYLFKCSKLLPKTKTKGNLDLSSLVIQISHHQQHDDTTKLQFTEREEIWGGKSEAESSSEHLEV